MKFRHIIPILFIHAFTAALLMSGCSDNYEQPTQAPSVDLTGTYQLVSIIFGAPPALEPPVAVGSLVLTSTDYDLQITLSVTVPGIPDTIIDRGTYKASGNTWTQESSLTPTQSTGTFSQQGDTLSVSVTTGGLKIDSVWRKTG